MLALLVCLTACYQTEASDAPQDMEGMGPEQGETSAEGQMPAGEDGESSDLVILESTKTVTGTITSIVGNEATLQLEDGTSEVYLLPVGMSIGGRGDFSTLSTGSELTLTFGEDPDDGSEIIISMSSR